MQNYIDHRISQGMTPKEALESARIELFSRERVEGACNELITILGNRDRTFEEDLTLKGAHYERDMARRTRTRLMEYISEWLDRGNNRELYC